MTIRIVTDSSCDLPPDLIQQLGITVVPILVHVGSAEYRDGVDLTRAQFYESLPGFRPPPTTAAPGPQAFCQTYEQLAAEGATEILSIHISRSLSATVDSARQAAAETNLAAVTAFDSRQLSLGMGYQVQLAAQAAVEGRSMREIVGRLEEQIMRTHVFAALDTLEFMRRGGRMSGPISALGNLLQIKPILKMYNGHPSAERVRTRRGAMRRLKEMLVQHAPFEKVSLLHSGAEARAKALLEEVHSLLPGGEIWLQEINPVLGTHIGPGVIGFACLSRRA